MILRVGKLFVSRSQLARPKYSRVLIKCELKRLVMAAVSKKQLLKLRYWTLQRAVLLKTKLTFSPWKEPPMSNLLRNLSPFSLVAKIGLLDTLEKFMLSAKMRVWRLVQC